MFVELWRKEPLPSADSNRYPVCDKGESANERHLRGLRRRSLQQNLKTLPVCQRQPVCGESTVCREVRVHRPGRRGSGGSGLR